MMIGRKIRELRQKKDWTLADLAKHSKVALSTLSRIETGKMTGTLESHIDIAKALGVRLPELYAQMDPNQPPVETHRASEQPAKVVANKGAHYALLTANALQKKMLPAFLHLPPHKSTQADQGVVGTEKLVYLIKGQLELTVGQETIPLKAGDSAYLQADHPHLFKNTGSTPAVALVVSTPPAL